MKKDDQYFAQVLAFARESLGSYKAVAQALGATSGQAVEAWTRNGVAHKWRPVLDKKFGPGFRKSLNGLLVLGRVMQDPARVGVATHPKSEHPACRQSSFRRVCEEVQCTITKET